jgi:cyclomaltodextrinase / maltogenic alpha-amylase / neopullulanase
MKDFIFGTLATEELRFNHARNRRAGVSHYQQREPRDPLPGQSITLELSVGPDHPCEAAWVYWTNDGTNPQGQHGKAIHGYAVPMVQVGVEWDTVLWGYIRTFKCIIPGQSAGSVMRYFLSAVGDDGQEFLADQGTMFACYIDDDPTPGWTAEAVIYQVFVDRFNPGEGRDWLTPQTPAGFYGGRIRGITEKLDYLSLLGVNVLWLTPIFPSPSHHGYDATDLFEIEPRLGTKADLRSLLDESHQRGIRILLDLVPNHLSNLHPTFQSAISSQKSSYKDWYTFTHWPDKYRSFFDVPDLPQLNLREPAARKYMLDAVKYWLDFGVDGYRVDYAVGPAPDFWADFRMVTRAARPDCWTFGEVVEPPDSQLNFIGGLDGCLDFNLLEAFRRAFAFHDWHPQQFASFLVRHESYFPESFSRPCFLDNHDMNRFLWAANGDVRRLRLAALCQFSLMGAPVIYYGTEVGLSQLRDVRQGQMGLPEESRLPMLWETAQDLELFEYYRSLIQARQDNPALRRSKAVIRTMTKDVLLFSKANEANIVVVLNLSEELQTVDIHAKVKKVLIETHAGDILPEDNGITISPLGGAILSIV